MVACQNCGETESRGELCFERGFADAVLNAVVVNRGIEEELAHLHAVTSDFFEEINVDFILVVSDLPYVSLSPSALSPSDTRSRDDRPNAVQHTDEEARNEMSYD